MSTVIQMHAQIDRKLDFVSNTRFSENEYDQAINEAIEQIVNDRYDNIKKKRNYSAEAIQRVKDELFTLTVEAASLTITNDNGAYPADYKHAYRVVPVIDSVERETEEVSYNQLSEMQRNTYTKPDDDYTKWIQNSTGITIYHGTGTLNSIFLDYMKQPGKVSAGTIRQHIEQGTGVLAATTAYVVLKDKTVYDGNTYLKGEEFTSTANTDLTYGKVVAKSNTTDSDLPLTIHKEIVDKAAPIMEGWIEDYQSKQSLEFDANKS